MKRLISATILGGFLLALAPAMMAQDCGNLSAWDLRGTYTMAGSGYIDLAKLIPQVPGLPSGFIPFTWVGAYTWNGSGGGGGWVTVNAGGTQMTSKFVGLKYSVNSDCSIQASFSLQIKELNNLTVGPVSRILVPAVKGDSLQLQMIFTGGAPGAPASPGFDSGVAYRQSMQF